MRKRPDYGDATPEDLARTLMRPKYSTATPVPNPPPTELPTVAPPDS